MISDGAFCELLRSAGIETVPMVSCPQSPRNNRSSTAANKQLEEASLRFVIAWAFLFPLFAKPNIKLYLQRNWPGFIDEMKDAFIGLVMEGPFPPANGAYFVTEISGHQG